MVEHLELFPEIEVDEFQNQMIPMLESLSIKAIESFIKSKKII